MFHLCFLYRDEQPHLTHPLEVLGITALLEHTALGHPNACSGKLNQKQLKTLPCMHRSCPRERGFGRQAWLSVHSI